MASRKAGDVMAAVSGVEIGTALHQIGDGLLKTYRAANPAERESITPALISVLQRLRLRGWDGDDILAAEMIAELRGEEPSGRPVAVDLDELGSTMADRGDYPGGYLNTETGEVIAAVLTDEFAVGKEDAVDVEDGDWVHFVEDGQESWQDMADFAAAVEDPGIRGMLEEAVSGKGAFSRFRRTVDRADLGDEWHCFVDDRRWGRARESLAALGLRPG